MRLLGMSVTEKDIRRILLKHSWLPYEYAKRMAEDRKRKNFKTPEARTVYYREYARLRRAEAKGEVTDVAGVISGKYLDKRGSSRKSKTAEQ
jgi:replication initiation and membrane attachment protein DnaB